MHPTRQKLLDTGLAIAADKGLRGLTVRELAWRPAAPTPLP